MSTVASQRLSSIPPRMVVMGVAGSGKTSIGEALADAVGATYIDGDTLHPQSNIDKMSVGIPLTDEDRWPWLKKVGETLATQVPPAIVGCSALRRAYRDFITSAAGGAVLFIYLDGSRDLIAARMNARTGHFMPTSLLDSQFATLEPPGCDENAISVSIDGPPAEIVTSIIGQLKDTQS